MSVLIFFGFSIFIVMVSTVYVVVSIKNLIRLKKAEKSESLVTLNATLNSTLNDSTGGTLS